MFVFDHIFYVYFIYSVFRVKVSAGILNLPEMQMLKSSAWLWRSASVILGFELYVQAAFNSKTSVYRMQQYGEF